MLFPFDNIQSVSFRNLVTDISGSKFSTHALHSYPGQLIPQIPYYYLNKYSKKEDSMVLDPFCGAGTVLVEAMHNNWYSVGVEINPVAALVTKVKTTPVQINKIEKTFNLIKNTFVNTNFDCIEVPFFDNINFWFEEQKITELTALKESINPIENEEIRDFFNVTFSSIIKTISRADPRIYVPVLPKFGAPKKIPDVWTTFEKRYYENKNKMKEFLKNIKGNNVGSHIYTEDIKNFKEPLKNVDLIITSPPYISAQKYVRSTRLEAYWLGYDKELQLEINRNTIGTEKIRRNDYKKIKYTNISKLDDVLNDIFEKNPEKAGIVSNYFNDMRKVIKKLYYLLNKKGRFILIIGDNTVTGMSFPTSKYVIKLCDAEGFIVDGILRDEIYTRGLMRTRKNAAKAIEYEYIVEMRKP